MTARLLTHHSVVDCRKIGFLRFSLEQKLSRVHNTPDCSQSWLYIDEHVILSNQISALPKWIFSYL